MVIHPLISPSQSEVYTFKQTSSVFSDLEMDGESPPSLFKMPLCGIFPFITERPQSQMFLGSTLEPKENSHLQA